MDSFEIIKDMHFCGLQSLSCSVDASGELFKLYLQRLAYPTCLCANAYSRVQVCRANMDKFFRVRPHSVFSTIRYSLGMRLCHCVQQLPFPYSTMPKRVQVPRLLLVPNVVVGLFLNLFPSLAFEAQCVQ